MAIFMQHRKQVQTRFQYQHLNTLHAIRELFQAGLVLQYTECRIFAAEAFRGWSLLNYEIRLLNELR